MAHPKRLFNPADYIELTMNFGCNLHCIHCMIENTMNWLTPQSMDDFSNILAVNKLERRWTGLILTGAEITLDSRLPSLARLAKKHGFQNIRIQTHGGKLANIAYLKELVNAGINEFFISVTGAEESVHDAITGVPGSFRDTLAAISNLSLIPDTSVITNTVITSKSYQYLPEIVSLLASFPAVVQIEFWNYFPMRSTDDKSLIARFNEVTPYLLSSLSLAESLGMPIEIKNYPHCLLKGYKHCLRNDQPQLEIDPRFWQEFMRNGFYQCYHQATCSSSECLGLNTAYINRYGWEIDILSPLPELI